MAGQAGSSSSKQFEDEDDFEPACKKRGWKTEFTANIKRHDYSKDTPERVECSVDRTTPIEFCPICQFPFKYLIGQNVEWHTMECLANQRNPQSFDNECFMGTRCTSRNLDHFRRFSHDALAKQRSNAVDMNINQRELFEGAIQNTAKGAGFCTEYLKMDNSYGSNQEDIVLDKGCQDILSEAADEVEFKHCPHFHKSSTVDRSEIKVSEDIDKSLSKRDKETQQFSTSFHGDIVATVIPPKLKQHSRSMTAGKSAERKATGKNTCQTDLNSYFGVKCKSRPKIDPSSLSASTSACAGTSGFESKRHCPFYKKIPGTSITVDAFNYGSIPGCSAYFLSHFHYDHYIGLKKDFKHNLYCSKITAALVCTQIKVDPKYVHQLPLDEEVQLEGIRVTLLDANHCPGSVMILFVLPNGERILHTGDFRAVQSMWEHPALKSNKTDILYLDTTYCSPEYNFPAQESVIDFAVEKSLEAVRANMKTLIVCGTYTIGKEKVFLAIANALDCTITARSVKKRILANYKWPDLEKRLSEQWNRSSVHVLPMNSINVKSLKAHLESHPDFKEVLAFKPTGWTHNARVDDLRRIRPTVSGSVTIYGVPYSEHSSYMELERFVKCLRPSRIIPTVNNGSPQRRKMMQSIFTSWLEDRT